MPAEPPEPNTRGPPGSCPRTRPPTGTPPTSPSPRALHRAVLGTHATTSHKSQSGAVRPCVAPHRLSCLAESPSSFSSSDALPPSRRVRPRSPHGRTVSSCYICSDTPSWSYLGILPERGRSHQHVCRPSRTGVRALPRSTLVYSLFLCVFVCFRVLLCVFVFVCGIQSAGRERCVGRLKRVASLDRATLQPLLD